MKLRLNFNRCIGSFVSLILSFSLIAFPASAVADASNESMSSVTLTYDEIKSSSIEMQDDCVILTFPTLLPDTDSFASYAGESNLYNGCAESRAVILISTSTETAEKVYDELTAIQHQESSVLSTRTVWDSGNSSKNTSSTVVGITLTLKLYYKYTTESGHEWYKLTKVIASNDKASSSSAVIGGGFVAQTQTLTCGVQGQNLEGLNGLKKYSSTIDIGKNSTSYTYTAPTSWPTVCEDTGLLGATYTLTATRTGKTYSVSVTNNLFNNLTG